MILLPKEQVLFDVDHTLSNNQILQDIVNKVDVLKLPAPIELVNTKEFKQWLNVELKKDYIEQGLRPLVWKMILSYVICCTCIILESGSTPEGKWDFKL